MHAVVIYDSNFGNTKNIAELIAHELKAHTVSVDTVTEKDLEKADVVVVGSPINGWRPTEKIHTFLESLQNDRLHGKKAAAFDTRVEMFLHGDAAGKIARSLEHAGAEIVTKPHGFFVKGQNGPLVDGEVEKAKQWADEIKETV